MWNIQEDFIFVEPFLVWSGVLLRIQPINLQKPLMKPLNYKETKQLKL